MTAMIPFPDISPEIFSFSIGGFEFALRWYAMAYIAGIIIAWRIVVHAMKRAPLWPNDKVPFNNTQVEEFLTWGIIGVVLGGRLGYVLFYKPAYYIENPVEILMVWQGGMAFHGGLLGVVVAALLFCRKHAIPLLTAADTLAMITPPGLLLGRTANFINAELWGRPTDMPWGVAFPGYFAQNCGQLDGVCARHPSQLYEAGLEGLLLGLLILWLVYARRALRTPGLVAGVFFAGYGLGRFIVEFFRQPDMQFQTEGNPLGLALHIGGYGLTMGQILSLPMILGGLWLARHVTRRRTG